MVCIFQHIALRWAFQQPYHKCILTIKALMCIFQHIANIVRDLAEVEKGNGVHILAYCLEVGLSAAIP